MQESTMVKSRKVLRDIHTKVCRQVMKNRKEASFEGDSHKGMQVSTMVKSRKVLREIHPKVCRQVMKDRIVKKGKF